MSDETNAYEAPSVPCDAGPRKKSTLLRVVEVLVVLAILLLLVMLLLPARRSASEAARRMSCGNNLKHIALALHHYEDKHGTLPPAYVVDENGKPLYSWRVLILPYMDQEKLYNEFHLDEPWDSEHNIQLAQRRTGDFECPSSSLPTEGPVLTTYMTVLDEHGLFYDDKPRSIGDVEALHRTLMLVEVPEDQAVPWTKPTDITMAEWKQLFSTDGSTETTHPGGTHVAVADCLIRFVPAGTTDFTDQ